MSGSAREQAIFGAATPFYGWHYPPFFLLLAAPLAAMPYWLALIVWQGATLVLYLWSTRAILLIPPLNGEGVSARSAETGGVTSPRSHMPLACRCALPAEPSAVACRHSVWLSRLQAQFGVLIPLVLTASARWRTFAAAAAVVILALGVSVAFGVEV